MSGRVSRKGSLLSCHLTQSSSLLKLAWFSPLVFCVRSHSSGGRSLRQKDWDWQGPLEPIWSKSSSQAGPPGCTGPCPDGFWVSVRMKPLQPLWATCASSQSLPVTFTVEVFLCVQREPLVCPLPPGLSLGITEKSLSPSSLHPSSDMSIHW